MGTIKIKKKTVKSSQILFFCTARKDKLDTRTIKIKKLVMSDESFSRIQRKRSWKACLKPNLTVVEDRLNILSLVAFQKLLATSYCGGFCRFALTVHIFEMEKSQTAHHWNMIRWIRQSCQRNWFQLWEFDISMDLLIDYIFQQNHSAMSCGS